MPYKLGEVRPAENADFEEFIHLCDSKDSDWHLNYNKNDIQVWTRLTNECDFKMFRVRMTLKDVAASTLYDVLHDPKYRKVWDRGMIDSQDLCQLDANNDICYYALRSMPPFKNRDFVMLRSWRQTPSEYIIFNHSVFHKEQPPKKAFVRALSYMTGYLVRPTGDKSCQLLYVAQCDPRGKLPKWAVNKAAHLVAPSVVKKLARAARNYPDWKTKHDPDVKPWLFPEQLTTPPVNWCDVLNQSDIDMKAPVFDESAFGEREVDETYLKGGDNQSDDGAVPSGESR